MVRAPSTLDARSARHHFSKAAQKYDQAAVIQREIADRLHEKLDYLKLSPVHVIDLGCGTGYSLAFLLKKYPKAELWGLDFAYPMLKMAQARLATQQSFLQKWLKKPAQHWIVGDLAHVPLQTASMNLIFSSLALQWSSDKLPQVFAEWQRILTLQGTVFFATLGPDTLKELREAFAPLDESERIHTFTDMHDIGDELVHAGFSDPVMEMEKISVCYTDPLAVFNDLKSIGALNSSPARSKGLMGKDRWNRMMDAWKACGQDGKWHVTYEVIYGHAWKTKTKLPDGMQPIKFY